MTEIRDAYSKFFAWDDQEVFYNIENTDRQIFTLDEYLKKEGFKYRVNFFIKEDDIEIGSWFEKHLQKLWTVAYIKFGSADCYYFQDKEDMLKCVIAFGGKLIEL